MITFPALPGIDINIFLLIFIGLGAGILSGFSGVGGAFVATPAMIIIGLPANYAVGTSLIWVMGNSIVGTFRHRKLGNVDTKLGLVTIVAVTGGVEVGVRIINWATAAGLADQVVLAISIVMLLIVGSYTLLESLRRKSQLDRMPAQQGELAPDSQATSLPQKLQRINLPPRVHFARSGITMSLWIILAVGFFIGLMVGILGVGGGFIMVPALIYLIGLPSIVAVGTSLFQIIFSSLYGSIRHTMSGNVIIFISLIMLIASSIGVQFGALVTRYVRGISVRFVLGLSILIAALAALLKLLYTIGGKTNASLEIWSTIVIFSGMGLAVLIITVLFLMARRHYSGQPIPAWLQAFISPEDPSAGTR